jgi:hypothetical protein
MTKNWSIVFVFPVDRKNLSLISVDLHDRTRPDERVHRITGPVTILGDASPIEKGWATVSPILLAYWAQIQTIAPAYLDAARFRRVWDSSCSRQRLLRRKSLGPVHSERLRVAAVLVDLGWPERRGRMRQRRHAPSVLLPLP